MDADTIAAGGVDCGRAARIAAVASIALTLASCAGSIKREPNITTATVNMEVVLTKAFVAPPPGGPSVVAVLQDIVPNAVSQEIALSTLSRVRGQNAFYVTMFRNDAIGSGDLEDRELKPNAIRKEMLSRLPGVAMQTSNFYVQNKYGPFGYAIGRSMTSDLCIYGWQRVVPNTPPSPFFNGPAGAISVRLRICDARASEAALLSLMYGYTINAYYLDYGWNPYGPPPEVPASVGQISAPISPIGQEGLGSAINGDTGPPAVAMAPPARRGSAVGRRSVQEMDAAYASPDAVSPMRGYQGANQAMPPGMDPMQSPRSASPPVGYAPPGGMAPSGGYVPQGTYSAPTARFQQPNQQMPVPTPLTGYPVVPQPGGQ